MKFAAPIFAFLLLAVPVAPAQHTLSNPGSDLVLLSSSDARGEVSIDRLESCFHQLLREWHHDNNSIPRVVVMHVSKRVARAASVTTTPAVRRNSSSDHGDIYYEVWLVDAPKIEDYLLAFENVIEQHYGLTPTDEERKRVLTRTSRVQNATVSVSEGK